jgi:pyruvate dehydrogenase E1 component alpha subunit
MSPDRDILVSMYESMTTARQCDERVFGLLRTGELSMFWLSARGQEVLGVAAAKALRRDDYLVTYYRGLPEQLAKGMQLRGIWAEWFGKETGVCRGKGGGIHVIDPDVGVMVNSGIIGGGLPIANGLALGSRVLGEDRVTMVTFGDGAVSEGAFHEALNLAALWKLPVVFLCQNNRYAENTSFFNMSPVDRVATRAAAYEVPGVYVDGNDAVAMYDATATAVDRARRGEGPTLIEAMTYRLSGHYHADDMAYMPKEELEAARANDPLPTFRAWLVSQGHASEAELAAIDEAARAAIEDAYAFAQASPDPGIEELDRDIVGVGV